MSDKNNINSKQLDKIVDLLSSKKQDTYWTIRSILDLCPKVVRLTFCLEVLRDIEPMLKDPRSKAVIPALEESIRTGKAIPTYIVAAANAANAANAAANADDAAYAATSAAYAAAYAAYVAYAAADAANAANAANANTREEKLQYYLSLLKKVILSFVPEDEDKWQLELLI